MLSFAKVSYTQGHVKLTYRKPVVYGSQATLFITQEGFPWGRATQGYLPGNPSTGTPSVPLGDTGRLSGLSVLYASLGNGDQVRRIVLRHGPIAGSALVTPVTAENNPMQVLPLLNINGEATSPASAIAIARRFTNALRSYIDKQQQTAHIPDRERVVLQLIERANVASVVTPRKKTLPIVVFLGVLIATVCLAFILENMKPRIQLVAGQEPAEPTEEMEASRTRVLRA